MKKRTSKFILLFISSVLLVLVSKAQSHKPQVLTVDSVPTLMDKQVFFNLAGVILWQFNDYGEIEGGIRANIRGKFLPVAEIGLGVCDKTHDETDIHFKTSSPFVRLGCDYNFARDIYSGNKVLGGLRLGYTSFKYDIDAPAIDDPYWAGNQMSLNYKGVQSNAFWAEFVFGLETKLWKRLRIGWTARYKRRLNQKENEFGKAWYIPGYGENDNHLFSGTFNILFDI